MQAAFSKAEIESEIAGRFVDAFRVHERTPPETLSIGVASFDNLIGGIPRGAITEIFGPTSSGRTSLMFSLLSYATTHDEICALVDMSNAFAPTAAAAARIDFERLLWIRCASNLENAFKATDLLLHAGGFGVVILDLGDVAGKDARRIITSWWYRFRRSIENKPTSVVVISQEACTRSCAALTLEMNGAAEWSTTSSKLSENGNVLPMRTPLPAKTDSPVTQANLLRRNSIKINRRRPLTSGLNEVQFKALNAF